MKSPESFVSVAHPETRDIEQTYVWTQNYRVLCYTRITIYHVVITRFEPLAEQVQTVKNIIGHVV